MRHLMSVRRNPSILSLLPLEDRTAPAAGALDPTFGTGGIVQLPTQGLTNSQTTTSVNFVAQQPDGGVVTVAEFSAKQSSAVKFVVYRETASGQLDPTFGSGGVVPLPVNAPIVSALATDSEGRVLIAVNYFYEGDPKAVQAQVLRLTAAGALDPTFGTGGIVNLTPGTNYGSIAEVSQIVIRPTGGVLLIGDSTPFISYNGLPPSRGPLAVVQLDSEGKLDTSFGTGGQAQISFPVGTYNAAIAEAAALGPDGSLVIVASVVYKITQLPLTHATATEYSTSYELGVARLTSTGALDTNFGTGGTVLFTPDVVFSGGTDFEGTGVGVRPDGDIIVAGNAPAVGLASIGLTPAGQIDPTYGSGGKVVL